MLEVKPLISSVGSNRSANCATTTALHRVLCHEMLASTACPNIVKHPKHFPGLASGRRKSVLFYKMFFSDPIIGRSGFDDFSLIFVSPAASNLIFAELFSLDT